jgi:hypothetical protein
MKTTGHHLIFVAINLMVIHDTRDARQSEGSVLRHLQFPIAHSEGQSVQQRVLIVLRKYIRSFEILIFNKKRFGKDGQIAKSVYFTWVN